MPYTATNNLNDLVETQPVVSTEPVSNLGLAELETRRTFKAVILNQHNADGTHKTLPGSAITAASVPAGSFVAKAVHTGDINDKAVTATQIADTTITAAQIAATTITGAQVADKTLAPGKLSSTTPARILVANSSGGYTEVAMSGAATITTAGVVSLAATSAGQAIAIFQDILATGSDGGTFTSGAWQKRVLNSTLIDSAMLFNLSSSVLTWSTPGTYYIRAEACGYGVDLHQLRLYDPINSVVLGVGTPAFALSGGSPQMTSAIIEAVITLAPSVTQKMELDHQCATTQASNGLGKSAGFTTTNNVFASITIIKLS